MVFIFSYHPNEQPWLLSGSSNAGVTNNTNSKSSGETCETDRETGTELNETLVEGHPDLDCGDNVSIRSLAPGLTHDFQKSRPRRRDRKSTMALVLNLCKTSATYSNDTSHDNWYNTLHHQVRPEHRHGRDADTRLCCAVADGNRSIYCFSFGCSVLT